MAHIPDPGLRRALNHALGGGTSTKVPSEFPDLSRLDRLSWSDEGEAEAYPNFWKTIGRLDGLEQATGLIEVSLGGNHIADLRPLAACQRLREAWLGGNAIVDLGPLGSLPELRRISAFQNPIATLTGLAGAKSLQILDLTDTRVRDFSPLFSLPALQELRAGSGYDERLPDEAIEQLAQLSLRGVSVNARQDQDRVRAAVARRRVKAPDPKDAVGAVLREAGVDELLALWQEGPGATDPSGATLLHLVVKAAPKIDEPSAWKARAIAALGAAGVVAERMDDNERNGPLALAASAPAAVFDAMLAVAKRVDFPPHHTPLAALLLANTKLPPEEFERRLRALLARGANPAALPALLAAVRIDREDLVDAALAKRPKLDLADRDWGTALSVATHANNLRLMEKLLDAGANPATAMAAAASADALRLLVARGADINAHVQPTLRVTILHRLGWWAKSTVTPEEQVLAWLDAAVSLGADPNARDHGGQTPLMSLVERNPYDPIEIERTARIIGHLGKLGANPALRNEGGKTAAAIANNPTIRAAIRALPALPVPPSPLNERGHGPLHEAVAEREPDALRTRVLELARAGADPGLLSWSGESALARWFGGIARKHPDADVFAALLCPAAAPSALRTIGYLRSSEPGDAVYRPWLDALIATGLDLTDPEIFLRILQLGEVDLVEEALQRGAAVAPLTLGDSSADPLCVAAQTGNAEIVKILLAAGASPHGDPGRRVIPLLSTYNAGVIGALLNAKANPNVRGSYDGRTALHNVLDWNMPEAELKACIDALLAAGADPNRPNLRGTTPRDLAKRRSPPLSL